MEAKWHDSVLIGISGDVDKLDKFYYYLLQTRGPGKKKGNTLQVSQSLGCNKWNGRWILMSLGEGCFSACLISWVAISGSTISSGAKKGTLKQESIQYQLDIFPNVTSFYSRNCERAYSGMFLAFSVYHSRSSATITVHKPKLFLL